MFLDFMDFPLAFELAEFWLGTRGSGKGLMGMGHSNMEYLGAPAAEGVRRRPGDAAAAGCRRCKGRRSDGEKGRPAMARTWVRRQS
jgi:hypothetical protein